MSKLEDALISLRISSMRRDFPAIDCRVQLLVTLCFIVVVVSVPMLDPGRIVWFLCFPIVMAEAFGIGYGKIFLRSLWLLPLIVVIGIFNPLLDRQPLWYIGNFVVSAGWVSFISVVLRGLLSVQALLILIASCGFNDMCRGLRSLGLPGIIVTQMLMIYRFLIVLIGEALNMQRARMARGFGRKSYPLKMWSVFIGQLLLRTFRRASRVDIAMKARGFNGSLHIEPLKGSLNARSYIYGIGWIAVILALRFVDMSALMGNFLSGVL